AVVRAHGIELRDAPDEWGGAGPAPRAPAAGGSGALTNEHLPAGTSAEQSDRGAQRGTAEARAAGDDLARLDSDPERDRATQPLRVRGRSRRSGGRARRPGRASRAPAAGGDDWARSRARRPTCGGPRGMPRALPPGVPTGTAPASNAHAAARAAVARRRAPGA